MNAGGRRRGGRRRGGRGSCRAAPSRRTIAPGPRPPDSHPPSRRALLIQSEWPARALIKAELENAGWDVLGADTVRLALDLSTARGFRPDGIVVDSVGLYADSSEINALRFLSADATLLLLESSLYLSSLASALSPSAVLRRPFTVGDVADALGSLYVRDEQEHQHGTDCALLY